jgi:glycosyltransferase involved in cell wall biosynthesis
MIGFHAGRLGGNASLLCRAGRLRPLGELSDTRPLIAAADVLLVSSDVEGFPNVVAESVLLGTPVVSTDVGDASRIVGDFGRICSPGDASALAEALVRVVQSRLKLNAAKATAAARRVAAMCDPATIAEQYMRIWGGGELVCDETSVR